MILSPWGFFNGWYTRVAYQYTHAYYTICWEQNHKSAFSGGKRNILIRIRFEHALLLHGSGSWCKLFAHRTFLCRLNTKKVFFGPWQKHAWCTGKTQNSWPRSHPANNNISHQFLLGVKPAMKPWVLTSWTPSTDVMIVGRQSARTVLEIAGVILGLPKCMLFPGHNGLQEPCMWAWVGPLFAGMCQNGRGICSF